MALQTPFTHSLTGARHGAAYARVQVINLRYDYEVPAAVVHLGVWPNATTRKSASEPAATHTYTVGLKELQKHLRLSDNGDARPAVYRWLKAHKPGEGEPDLRKAAKV